MSEYEVIDQCDSALVEVLHTLSSDVQQLDRILAAECKRLSTTLIEKLALFRERISRRDCPVPRDPGGALRLAGVKPSNICSMWINDRGEALMLTKRGQFYHRGRHDGWSLLHQVATLQDVNKFMENSGVKWRSHLAK